MFRGPLCLSSYALTCVSGAVLLFVRLWSISMQCFSKHCTTMYLQVQQDQEMSCGRDQQQIIINTADLSSIAVSAALK